MSKSRHYCAVYGCQSQKTNKQLSFFTLPKDEERRKKWLEIIDRPELMKPNIKPNSYIICSKHFNKSSMVFVPQLKPDALPTRYTQESKRDQATQTNDILQNADQASKLTTHSYPNIVIKSENTQPAAALSRDTQRKRSLSKDFQQSNLKKSKLQIALEKIKKEV